jgi:NitT/TauT family transport system ATP-binding protein
MILFVTHSIEEAIRVGNRILLLSAYPGTVKAEIRSSGIDQRPDRTIAVVADS